MRPMAEADPLFDPEWVKRISLSSAQILDGLKGARLSPNPKAGALNWGRPRTQHSVSVKGHLYALSPPCASHEAWLTPPESAQSGRSPGLRNVSDEEQQPTPMIKAEPLRDRERMHTSRSERSPPATHDAKRVAPPAVLKPAKDAGVQKKTLYCSLGANVSAPMGGGERTKGEEIKKMGSEARARRGEGPWVTLSFRA
jgi:hypothetical protein